MRKIISGFIISIIVFIPFITRADTVQVTLASGEILELYATIPALFEVTQIANGVIISMKGGSFITVTSLSTKKLFVQPLQYASGGVCVTGSSSVMVSVPSAVPIADVTITLGSSLCGATPIPSPSSTPSSSPEASTEPVTSSLGDNPGSGLGGGSQSTITVSPSVVIQPNETVSNNAQSRVFGNLVDTTSNLNTIIATAGTVATMSTLLAVYLAELGQIFQTFETFKFWLLYILGLRKKRPWGIVTNRYLAKPIPGVVVEVFDTEYKKLRDTQLTDNEGRFMFILEKGEYFIKLNKEGFESYQSEIIKVEDPNNPVFLNIAIIPERFYGVEVSVVGGYRRVFGLIRDILVKINPYLLLTGTLLTVYNISIIPTNYNYFVLGLYIIFDCVQVYYLLTLSRSYGVVTDGSSGSPVDLAIVRLFDYQRQLLLSSKTSDRAGRFTFLVKKGDYYLTSYKTGYDEFHSDKIIFRHDNVLNENIVMKIAQ